MIILSDAWKHFKNIITYITIIIPIFFYSIIHIFPKKYFTWITRRTLNLAYDVKPYAYTCNNIQSARPLAAWFTLTNLRHIQMYMDLGIYSCTLVTLDDGAVPLHKIARSNHGYHWSSTPPRFEHFRLAQGAWSCGATTWEQRHMYNGSSKENFITSFLNERKEWPRSRYTSRFYDILDYECRWNWVRSSVW